MFAARRYERCGVEVAVEHKKSRRAADELDFMRAEIYRFLIFAAEQVCAAGLLLRPTEELAPFGLGSR